MGLLSQEEEENKLRELHKQALSRYDAKVAKIRRSKTLSQKEIDCQLAKAKKERTSFLQREFTSLVCQFYTDYAPTVFQSKLKSLRARKSEASSVEDKDAWQAKIDDMKSHKTCYLQTYVSKKMKELHPFPSSRKRPSISTEDEELSPDRPRYDVVQDEEPTPTKRPRYNVVGSPQSSTVPAPVPWTPKQKIEYQQAKNSAAKLRILEKVVDTEKANAMAGKTEAEAFKVGNETRRIAANNSRRIMQQVEEATRDDDTRSWWNPFGYFY